MRPDERVRACSSVVCLPKSTMALPSEEKPGSKAPGASAACAPPGASTTAAASTAASLVSLMFRVPRPAVCGPRLSVTVRRDERLRAVMPQAGVGRSGGGQQPVTTGYCRKRTTSAQRRPAKLAMSPATTILPFRVATARASAVRRAKSTTAFPSPEKDRSRVPSGR